MWSVLAMKELKCEICGIKNGLYNVMEICVDCYCKSIEMREFRIYKE